MSIDNPGFWRAAPASQEAFLTAKYQMFPAVRALLYSGTIDTKYYSDLNCTKSRRLAIVQPHFGTR